MKIYAKVDIKILYIDEKDKEEFMEKYNEKWSVNQLEKIPFGDTNVLKMELIKSKQLDKKNDFLMY